MEHRKFLVSGGGSISVPQMLFCVRENSMIYPFD